MLWFKALFSAIVICFILDSNSYGEFYRVRSGDSLIKISKKLNIKPALIKKYNPNVKWLRIRPGEKIIIPSKDISISSRQQITITENKIHMTYTVKKGDSLIKISKKLNIKPALIKKYNPNVKWLRIRPGEKIIIPSFTIDQKANMPKKDIYVVQRNDSLIKISKKLNISMEEIKKLNPDIDWSKIQPNNTIKIPSTINKDQIKTALNNHNHNKNKIKKNVPPSIAFKKELIIKKCPMKPGDIGNGYYIVKSGDTLSSIARRFGLTLKHLMELNPNKSKFIKPGDLIVLPGQLTKKIMISKNENLYIPPKYLVYSTPYKIKRGDSLYKIAKKFKTKVYVIKMLNNLGGNILRVGSYIFVPNKNMIHKNRIELEYSLLRERRKAIVHYAERFLGRPYRFGGDSLIHGIDCSAFVQKIYEKFIKAKLPRTAEEQYRTVGVFVSLKRIQVGDLLFFHTMNYARVTHVGIYIGNNRFIHAAGRRSGIKISRLTRYYLRRLVGVKRILSISNRYAYLRHRPG